jgi:hypothetical protein
LNAKVYIYWNFRKKCFSAKKNGKVFAHFRNASIFKPEFRVSVAGRERVNREHVKNVHAYIVCEPQHCVIYSDDAIVHGQFAVPTNSETAKYNPYGNETFVDNTGNALYNARTAELTTVEEMRTFYAKSKTRVPVIYITREKNEPVQS